MNSWRNQPQGRWSIKLIETAIPDVWIIEQNVFHDQRGSFVKTFHYDLFKEHNLAFELKESYYSTSRKDVIRGMHFQTPPFDHAKVATVLVGHIVDVVLDLRVGSPTFGRYVEINLSQKNRQSIYIPSGCAHGFCSIEEESLVYYNTTSVYSPTHDKGVLYSSFNYEWPTRTPILSPRDQSFPSFQDFDSPFRFKG